MSSSREGAEKRAARERAAGTEKADETVANEKGVTRITSEERDPIAAALKRVYEDAATEPLPDDLSRLLSQLEAAEKDA